MKRGNSTILIVALFMLVVLLLALPPVSEAQPTWKKFRYDEAQTGRSSEIACRGGDLIWTFGTNNFNFCSPAITENEEICFGSRSGMFFGLSSSGALEWQFDAIARVDSSPAIDSNGNIYFGANNGLLYCISGPTVVPTEATLEWAYDAMDVVYSSPTLDKDEYSVFFGTADGRLISVFSQNFPSTQGTLQWSFELGDDIFASPAYRYYDLPPTGSTVNDVAMVFIGVELGLYDGLVYAIGAPTDPATSTLATIVWVYPGIDDKPIGPVQSSVAVSEDGNFIYFGSKDGNLYCLTSSGFLHWSYETSGMIDSSPAIFSDGDVVVGSRDGAVYAVDVEGDLKWSFETGDAIESSPAIDANDNVLIGSRDGYLYSISPDGAQNWLFQADYHIWSSPVIGKMPSYGSGPTPLVTTATVYFTCADHKIYALCEDRTVPYFLSRSPAPRESGVSRRLAYITFEIVDDQSDVDRESIVMYLRGQLVHPTFVRIQGDTYRGWKGTYYCGDEDFFGGEMVPIDIIACDTAWEPNCIHEIYPFTIETGRRPSVAPLPGVDLKEGSKGPVELK